MNFPRFSGNAEVLIDFLSDSLNVALRSRKKKRCKNDRKGPDDRNAEASLNLHQARLHWVYVSFTLMTFTEIKRSLFCRAYSRTKAAASNSLLSCFVLPDLLHVTELSDIRSTLGSCPWGTLGELDLGGRQGGKKTTKHNGLRQGRVGIRSEGYMRHAYGLLRAGNGQ